MSRQFDSGSTGTARNVEIKAGQIQTASLVLGTVGDIQINSGNLSMADGPSSIPCSFPIL